MKRTLQPLLIALAFSLPFALAPSAAQAQDAESVLRRASSAMGADKVKTIRFAGSGTGATFGQAYKPGAAWPASPLEKACAAPGGGANASLQKPRITERPP